MPAPGSDTFIVDDDDPVDVAGVLVHRADGRTSVLPDPTEESVLTSGPSGPGWTPGAGLPGAGASSDFTGALAGDGSLEVTLTSNWGIDPAGVPFYVAAGADPADAAWPSIDVDGSFVLTQLAGGTA